jgi:hypothetical protein
MKAMKVKTEKRKLRIMFAIGFVGILLTMNSCLIKSLHPFYTKDDIIVDDRIIGNWETDNGKTHWEIFKTDSIEDLSQGFMPTKKIYQPYYQITIIEEKKDTSLYRATIFSLNEKTYIDFFLYTDYGDFANWHTVRSHSVAKINISEENKITLSWFSEEWLATVFKEGRIRIPHEKIYSENPDMLETIIITASTSQLQKFLLKYDSDKIARKMNFKQDDKNIEVILKRK